MDPYFIWAIVEMLSGTFCLPMRGVAARA